MYISYRPLVEVIANIYLKCSFKDLLNQKSCTFRVCTFRQNQFVKTVTHFVVVQVYLFIHYKALEKVLNRDDRKRREMSFQFKAALVDGRNVSKLDCPT